MKEKFKKFDKLFGKYFPLYLMCIFSCIIVPIIIREDVTDSSGVWAFIYSLFACMCGTMLYKRTKMGRTLFIIYAICSSFFLIQIALNISIKYLFLIIIAIILQTYGLYHYIKNKKKYKKSCEKIKELKKQKNEKYLILNSLFANYLVFFVTSIIGTLNALIFESPILFFISVLISMLFPITACLLIKQKKLGQRLQFVVNAIMSIPWILLCLIVFIAWLFEANTTICIIIASIGLTMICIHILWMVYYIVRAKYFTSKLNKVDEQIVLNDVETEKTDTVEDNTTKQNISGEEK